MISLFRIDFRLLHYQTSQVWPKKLDINMIVVANDAVIQDSAYESDENVGSGKLRSEDSICRKSRVVSHGS